ncbi:MAG TPA: hypothetical protein VJW73_18415 [Gemmatimonadaceae bacterium]|nr:hypothetical protein [Gemmatimonadaceae bacterium]
MRALSAAFALALCAAPAVVGMSSEVTSPRSARSRAPDPADSLLWMEMRNVDLHIDARQVMHTRVLRGEVVRAMPGVVPFLDDPKTFHVRVTNGVVALNSEAIATLLNTVAFNYPGAPIRHLSIRIENGQLVQKGILHKGVDIPFEMWAAPKLQGDGRLRLHPSRLHIFSVNGLTLMHALGLHMDKLMDLRQAHGVTVDGDDLFIDPLLLIPPPTVSGRLAAVRIEDSLFVQEFVRTPDDTIFGTYVRPDSSARNFVYFRGGELRFGKLTMHDTDLLIGDDDERDPLDLYLTQYNKQLVAGRAKNLPNFGLRTWLVDYRRIAGEPVRSPNAAATGGTP